MARTKPKKSSQDFVSESLNSRAGETYVFSPVPPPLEPELEPDENQSVPSPDVDSKQADVLEPFAILEIPSGLKDVYVADQKKSLAVTRPGEPINRKRLEAFLGTNDFTGPHVVFLDWLRKPISGPIILRSKDLDKMDEDKENRPFMNRPVPALVPIKEISGLSVSVASRIISTEESEHKSNPQKKDASAKLDRKEKQLEPTTPPKKRGRKPTGTTPKQDMSKIPQRRSSRTPVPNKRFTPDHYSGQVYADPRAKVVKLEKLEMDELDYQGKVLQLMDAFGTVEKDATTKRSRKTKIVAPHVKRNRA